MNPAVALIAFRIEDWPLNQGARPGARHLPLLNQTRLQTACSLVRPDDRL